MRMIRRLVLLAIMGAGGLAAFNYVPGNAWLVRRGAAALEGAMAKQDAATLATAATKASAAAIKFGDTVSESTLTAKIRAKMALDDRVKAGSIEVNTSGTIVTLTGLVRSADERDRAVRLARETDGVTKVVDKLRVEARPSAGSRK